MKRNKFKSVLIISLFSFTSVVITFLAFSNFQKTAAAGTMSGRVFQDFNGNGVYDTSGTSPNYAIDIGIGNVTVTAYNPSGAQQGSTTTAANGIFSFSATGTGPFRIEFTNLPSGYVPSARSTDSVTGGSTTNSGSTVQFVNDANTSNINLALNHPADYSQNNPNYAITRLGHGDPTDTSNANIGALYRFPYDVSGNSPHASRVTLRNAPNVGSVWGLAWNRSNSQLYVSSVLRRHTGLGSGGLGAIYRVSNAASGTPSSTLFYDFGASVGTVASNATRFSAGTGSTGAYNGDNIDAAIFNDAAKKGLGDIEVSDDGNTLYATNLNDRNVYAINTSGTPTATVVGSSPWASNSICTNGVARPWALKYYRGNLYVGLVCDASVALSSGSCNFTSGCSALTAHIYRWNGVVWSSIAPSPIALNYQRSKYENAGSGNFWHPWANAYSNIKPYVDFNTNGFLVDVSVAQPMVTGIEFDEQGSMIIGLGSRTDFQLGYSAPAPDSTNAGEEDEHNFSGGDILRCFNNAGTQELENNGVAGTFTGTGQTLSGLGGREFYDDVWWTESTPFSTQDTAIGGLGSYMGTRQVLLTQSDALDLYGAGVSTYSNTNGAHVRTVEVYDDGNAGPIAKSGGLGDLEFLSNAAPIEIGNRVWRDTDNDGVQDPGELPIANVTVRLYDSNNVLVGTAVTDANGEYYFVSSTVVDPNTGDNAGQVNGGILFNSNYQIRFDNPANYASGGPLFGLFLSPSNSTIQNGDDDSSDSDATSVTNPTNSPAGTFPVIPITTGSAGQNNHTLDTGFKLSPTAANVSIGGRISATDGRGIRNVILTLTLADGTTKIARSGAFGYYNFEEIESGQTVTVSVNSKRFNFNQTTRIISVEDAVDDLDFIADGFNNRTNLRTDTKLRNR